MRAQSAVIGVMLFFVSMIIMGAMFLWIVSKTIKLLDAGRMEIEFLTRKAQERIEVGWKFEPAGRGMYYPVLVINNTGPVPVDIVRIHAGIRGKWPSKYWWPKYYEGPWILQPNITVPVGCSREIKIDHTVNLELVKKWYRDNMTRILQARILTSYGNVFITVYVPWKSPSPSNGGGFNTILFCWSALDWMDVENNI